MAIEILTYKKWQLAKFYGVSVNTFAKELEKMKDQFSFNLKNKKTFYPSEVKIIVDHLGQPNEETQSKEK